MELVYRAAFIFFFMWFLTRALGTRELMQMSAFELIVLVTMGDLVQQGVTQEDMSVTGAMLAVGTIALLVVATSYVGFRWRGSKKVIEGVPIVVVDQGKVLDEPLAMERLTPEEVVSSAREQGIADLTLIRYGVIEPDGTFSFVLRGPEVRHTAPDKPS